MKARPRFMSPVPRGFRPTDVMAGYLWLGMEPYPQNIEVAAVLEATKPNGKKVYDEVVIVMPRRASKTTGIWAVLIGRCLNNPRHKVAFSAQNGLKASEIFLDMLGEVERAWSEYLAQLEADCRDAGVMYVEPRRPFKPKRGAGHEAIEFDNGSRMQAYPPEAAAFRSAAADTVFIDESQEHGPTKADELIGGVSPLMDTKKSPQMIFAGTPGKKREGLLWDELEAGRKGEIGIVEYSADDDDDVTRPANWRKWHPGINTLTEEETIAKRFARFPLLQFRREYCCQWPIDVTDKAIDPKLWEAARTLWAGRAVERPARFAIGYDVDPQAQSAAVAVAWRDDEGDAHVEVIAHRAGVGWLPRFLEQAAKQTRGVPIGFDKIGANIGAFTDARTVPLSRWTQFVLGQTAAATVTLYALLKEGRLHHYDQPSLNVAVDGAGRRSAQSESGWLWSRRSSEDVTPLVAATIALGTLDRMRTTKGIGVI